mgnify:CR=1 FL=1
MDLTPERDPLTVEAFSSKQNEQRASAQKRFEDTIAEIDVRLSPPFFLGDNYFCERVCFTHDMVLSGGVVV